MTGKQKKSVTKTLRLITVYRSQSNWQPIQSSSSGHSVSECSFEQGKVSVSTQLARMESKQVERDTKKTKNALLLRTPTQLFSQGQWWSNRSTHLLQMAQWRERGVRSTRQSGHISIGCIFESRSKKSCDGRRYPGSLADAMKKLKAIQGLKVAIKKAK
eukprot:CAMPEP_0170452794 /NCGR_PEP_ID=MMETSP0123-20130129/1573_1 /TAXON_ID=182087 /ORGANISM="Favella ehrenbergii, Strain Fehren 1" /LENGTH=158 /DNA_ID=CAMNT_0010714917 /DNA_START=887 /DNA_END=1363 /DNA_ORIENTATION=-